MTRIVTSMALATALAATTAQAQGRTEHTRIPIAGGVETFDAGTVCDFDYEIEELAGGWIIRHRFYDEEGNRIRAILHIATTIRHKNLEVDPPLVLEETYQYTMHRDLRTGEETDTGNFWHLRTADGKLVFVGAGRYVFDLATFELLETTPNTGAEAHLAGIVCGALGGAPAGP
jgi:hypothetical protein